MAFVIWIIFSWLGGLFSLCWNFWSARRGQNRMEGLWDQLGVSCGAFRTYYCRKPEKRSKTRLCGMDPDHFGFLCKLGNLIRTYISTRYIGSKAYRRYPVSVRAEDTDAACFWCHYKGDFFVNLFILFDALRYCWASSAGSSSRYSSGKNGMGIPHPTTHVLMTGPYSVQCCGSGSVSYLGLPDPVPFIYIFFWRARVF